MKTASLLACLAFFLLTPGQAQTIAQTTYKDWQIPKGDDPLTQDIQSGTQAPAVDVWRPMNGPGLPPLTQLNINVILADPIDPKILYLGTSPDYGEYGGVYRTTDGGLNWSTFNTGIAAHAAIDMLAITPDGEVLYGRDSNYASTGLFRTTTDSSNWSKLTTPLGVAAMIFIRCTSTPATFTSGCTMLECIRAVTRGLVGLKWSTPQ